MNNTLRERMLACAEGLVNGLSVWVQDHPEADLAARDGVVLGRAVRPARAAGCGRCGRCGGSGHARSRRAVEFGNSWGAVASAAHTVLPGVSAARHQAQRSRSSRPPEVRVSPVSAHVTENSASAFSGYRWPADVILTAVPWYLAYPLSSRQVLELLAERGIDVSHRTVLNWVQACGPRLADEVRRQRHPVGKRWFVDEVFLFRKGHKRYLYRAIDEDGVVVDVLVRERRDTASAAAFFRQAIERTGVIPHEVITDRHQPYITAVAIMCPGAQHIRTVLHRAHGETTRTVERSHLPTRDRLRNSRGLKGTQTGQRFLEGFAAVRHLRRDGRPGAGHLVRGPGRHAHVREVVLVIHALGHGLRRY